MFTEYFQGKDRKSSSEEVKRSGDDEDDDDDDDEEAMDMEAFEQSGMLDEEDDVRSSDLI